jgi:hypothetical protein
MSQKRAVSPLALERFIRRNELFKNPMFVNAPILRDSGQEGTSALELELEARGRLKDLLLDEPRGALTELLQDFVEPRKLQKNPTNPDQTVVEQTGEYPEYLYHVSKGKDGRLYLRVVRSLLIDKG